MSRAITIDAPDATWEPHWLMHWCTWPWVPRGILVMVGPDHWDRKDVRDISKWPRVKGARIEDPGYDFDRWYPIPVPMFVVRPLGTTLYDERYAGRALQL